MGKILHLLYSEPDETVAELIAAINETEGVTVVCLYPDRINDAPVDWNRLVDDIFAHERIISWW